MMLVRPLGNTGLRLSAIGLGGHWPTADGRRYEDHFAGNEVPAAIVANRTEVVSACLDAGINYIDITTAAEALAYGRALDGRRDRFIIGADDYLWSARNADCINVEALTANVERCLARLRTDYIDIWRVTAEVHGRNTDAQLETVIETADRLAAAGKIRHLGMSSHHAGRLHRAIISCPALELVLIPCLPPVACVKNSSRINQPEAQARVSARSTLACASGWFTKSLVTQALDSGGNAYSAATEHRLGIIGIKPFAGGAMFSAYPADPLSPDADDLARLALRWILQHRPEVACVVPGLASVTQVHNAAAAAADTPAMTADEITRLQHAATVTLKALPPEYSWLANWVHPQPNP